MSHQSATHGGAAVPHEVGGPPGFGPWVQILWSYRRTMLTAGGVVLAVSVALLVLAAVMLPSDRIGSIEFRLTFDGAATGEFPNGVPFNAQEFVSSPVMAEVYQHNDLARYGKLGDFASQVFVLQSNREIELLDFQYQSKLADARLTPVDREKLEEEYQRRRATLVSPDYIVSMRRSDILRVMPREMIAKTLGDVLTTWARQAVERKGALKYDIPIVSRNTITPEMLAREDDIIGADMLRAQAHRLGTTIGKISALPGASLVRSRSGGLTLAELGAKVEDELRFKIQPLFQSIRTSGFTKDPVQLDFYFSSQLMFARLKRDEAAARAQAYDEPLRGYLGAGKVGPSTGARGNAFGDTPTLMPQLSDRFLDQLMTLSRQADDVKFRQELTRQIVLENLGKTELDREVTFYEGLRTGALRPAASSPTRQSAPQRLSAQATEALEALNVAADQVLEIYDEVSARNLSPEGGLFAVTSPFKLTTVAALSLGRAMLLLISIGLLTLVVVPGSCLLHFYSTRRSSHV